MTGKTHIIGGVATGLALAHFTNYDPVLLTAAGALGGLIPDICHGGSKIGRKAPLLSKIISTLFGHRTFTHSLLFLIIINSLLAAFLPNGSIKAGILAGMISHIVLDAGTKKGIKLFYPLKIPVRLPLTTRTGSAAEQAVFALISAVAIYYGLEAFGGYRLF
ncbi:metal-dependent hydrolase [Metabacillus sp. GX 13764]|uniref:metal-dependent hydrolase n=1 Tax=Metabacillus kandeliae TaxID=2900151 RepID=UPI001E4A1908|nr:metal-dependent hydrolase [Metabacillus kandeliae]MCD7036042.1 metal-dependent hydrolase [Metabacillus kandeliae]